MSRRLFGIAAWVTIGCIAVAVPGYAQKGKGGGTTTQTVFNVTVRNADGTLYYTLPTYEPGPGCKAVASGNNNYYAVFPRHDLCATVTTNNKYKLTDDIVIQVFTTNGLITSVKLTGQDVIGDAGIMHESEVVALTTPVTPSTAGFTLHVHADNLAIWKLSRHLGGKRVAIVGFISLGDMIYTPQQ